MKVLLLMMIVCSSYAQQVFVMQMDVKEVNRRDNRCYEDITVTWGQLGDTLAFHYNERLIKLWEFRDYNSADKKRVLQLRYQQNECPNNLFLYLKDEFEERWYARFDRSEEGIVIYLSNLTVGKPHIMFNFTKYKICEL